MFYPQSPTASHAGVLVGVCFSFFFSVFTKFNFARRPSFSRLGVLISQIKTAGYLCNITMTKMQSTERGCGAKPAQFRLRLSLRQL